MPAVASTTAGSLEQVDRPLSHQYPEHAPSNTVTRPLISSVISASGGRLDAGT